MPAPQRQPAVTPPPLIKAPVKTHPAAPTAVESRTGHDASKGPNRMLCARVPLDLHDEVKVFAARRRTSVQAIVTEALEAYLSGH